jgi:hypothetical protein
MYISEEIIYMLISPELYIEEAGMDNNKFSTKNENLVDNIKER